MRVVIAPDCFGGTLSSMEAAEAIAGGWRTAAPGDDLVLRPLADGGPGFISVLHTALGGRLHRMPVTGPLAEPVPACWLEHRSEHGGTAYVEAAQACGLHLVPARRRDPLAATTAGVGELLAAAIAAKVHTVVVGLGGSATTDGGAGMLAALGAPALDGAGVVLPPGGGPLASCARLGGWPDLGGVRLVAASDVRNPLLGPDGAARVFGPQKGADGAAVDLLERAMGRWADVLAEPAGSDHRADEAAGAAGGLGFALLALGATVTSGAGLVRRLTGLDDAVAGADLVITGEGSFDRQSLRGKLVTGVAAAAVQHGVPCVALAGQVGVDPDAAARAGITAAYAVADHAGSVGASLADPAGTLAALAAHVATGRRDSCVTMEQSVPDPR